MVVGRWWWADGGGPMEPPLGRRGDDWTSSEKLGCVGSQGSPLRPPGARGARNDLFKPQHSVFYLAAWDGRICRVNVQVSFLCTE